MTAARSRPEVLAFLDAIKDTPEDDTPRLILADWLEEHGDEADRARAEFIRIQGRMDPLGRTDPQRWELRQREIELIHGYDDAWLGPVRGLVRETYSDRGLTGVAVEGAGVAPFVTQANFRLEAWAWINEVRLDRGKKHFWTLLSSPILGQLTSLNLSRNNLRAEGIRTLVQSPHLGRLTTLDLGGNQIGDHGLAALADCPSLTRLTTINLSGNRLIAFDPLVNSPNFSRLRKLSLAFNYGLVSGGAKTLAASPNLERLTDLDLHDGRIGAAEARALASSPHLGQLTTLWLTGNQIGDKGAKELARSPYLTRLTVLRLDDNRIGSAGARALASSPRLATLTGLHLNHNQIEDDGARSLATSPFLTRLTELELFNNPIRSDTKELLRERFGSAVQV